MTYQISGLFPPFACFLFLRLSIFMIHSVASWEKTQLLNQRLNSVRLLPSQESLCDCPEHEIIAHRRQSVAQRRLSTKVWEGRIPLVFPLFAMVILSIGFALMLFARHQGTMACLGCTLKSFAGRAEEPCWSMLQKKKKAVRNATAFHGQTWIQGHAHHLPQILPPPPCVANTRQPPYHPGCVQNSQPADLELSETCQHFQLPQTL